MTDAERTSRQATGPAAGTKTESTAVGTGQNAEQGGLLAKLTAAARNAVSAVTERRGGDDDQSAARATPMSAAAMPEQVNAPAPVAPNGAESIQSQDEDAAAPVSVPEAAPVSAVDARVDNQAASDAPSSESAPVTDQDVAPLETSAAPSMAIPSAEALDTSDAVAPGAAQMELPAVVDQAELPAVDTDTLVPTQVTAPTDAAEAVPSDTDVPAVVEPDGNTTVDTQAPVVEAVQVDAVAPVELDPAVPAEAAPVASVEADPVAPVEADPVAPAEMDASTPVEAQADVPADAEPATASDETAQEGEPAGASFDPSEEAKKGGKPRRFRDVQAGMQLEGRVTSIALYGIFVDVGVGRDGLVHISEMSDQRVESPTDMVKIGDPVNVWVKSVDPDAWRISLTMRDPHRAKPPRERRPRRPQIDREKLAELKSGDMVDGTVSSIAPFGVFVDIGVGKDGLVHISELSEDRIEKAEDAVQVGGNYTFRILEVDPDGKRISLSLRRAQRVQRLQQLEPGTVLDGTVSGMAPFGAFVDIGVGRDGLVHISELSSDRVGSVEEVVKAGDKIKVKVIEVDQNSKRISLTMRVEEPAPADRPQPARGMRSAGSGEENVLTGNETVERQIDYSKFERRPDRAASGARGKPPRQRRDTPTGEPEVYSSQDPDEETFTGDATLEDLMSKFNAGKSSRRTTRRDDADGENDEETETEGTNNRRSIINRTLAIMDDE